MYRIHIINRALGLLALAAILAMLLVACGDEEEPTAPAAAGQSAAPPTVEAMMEEATATPVPIPTAPPTDPGTNACSLGGLPGWHEVAAWRRVPLHRRR